MGEFLESGRCGGVVGYVADVIEEVGGGVATDVYDKVAVWPVVLRPSRHFDDESSVWSFDTCVVALDSFGVACEYSVVPTDRPMVIDAT